MRGSSQRRPARGGTGHTSSSAAAPRWSRRRASCPRPRPRGPLQTTGPTPRLPHQTQTPARAEQPPCAPRSPLIYDGDQQHYVEMATLHLRGRQHSHAPASHHSPDLSVSIFDIHARAKAGQRNAAPHERACVHGRGQAHRAPHHGPGSSLDDQLGSCYSTACKWDSVSRACAPLGRQRPGSVVSALLGRPARQLRRVPGAEPHMRIAFRLHGLVRVTLTSPQQNKFARQVGFWVAARVPGRRAPRWLRASIPEHTALHAPRGHQARLVCARLPVVGQLMRAPRPLARAVGHQAKVPGLRPFIRGLLRAALAGCGSCVPRQGGCWAPPCYAASLDRLLSR